MEEGGVEDTRKTEGEEKNASCMHWFKDPQRGKEIGHC